MSIAWNDCRVIAHRGASRIAPENTLIALQMAADLGAQWVECDVVLTADSQPIIFHDDTLDRTTNGQGGVAELSFAKIRELDAGSWFSSQFVGEQVPSLVEWLQLARNLGLSLNLELKTQPQLADVAAEQLIAALNAHWPQQKSNLLVSSFSVEHLQAVRRLDTKINLALLCVSWSEDYLSIVKSLNCCAVNINAAYAHPEAIKAIRQHGYQVLVYTVDDVQQAQHLYELGAAGVFSNYANLLNFTGRVCTK